MRFIGDAVPMLRPQAERQNAIEQARQLIRSHNLSSSLVKVCRNLGIGLVTRKELEGVRLYALDGSFSADIADQINERRIFTVETRRENFKGPRDQVVALMALRQDFREFSHVEAFAGTGKTHLVRTLLASEPPEGSIYMVKNRDQGLGLQVGGDEGVEILTWGQVLHRSLQAFVHAKRLAYMRPQPFGTLQSHPELLTRLAAEFGVPASLIEAAYLTLQRWARRVAADVDASDVPYPLRPEGLSGTPAVDQLRVAALARQLWSQQDRMLRGKAATIPLTTSLYARFFERHRIPLAYQGTIFLDEAHDVPTALARLLEAHPGGAVCLGDANQAFGQESPAWTRGRQLVMSESVRFGGAATSLVNSAIGLLAKDATSPRVMPNITLNTKVLTLRGDEGRYALGLHVYGSPATLVRDAMAMRAEGRGVFVAEASRRACKAWAARTATTLAQDPTGAGAALLDQLSKLAKGAKDPDLVGWVERSFSRLQDSAGVDMLLNDSEDPSRQTWLVLAEHARNLEKPVVAIHPCVFARGMTREHLKHYYVAASRARETIWLPPNAWR